MEKKDILELQKIAITIIAPKSSTIAKAVRKMAILRGAPLAAIAKIPKEKAISVAIGIPQPETVSCPIFTR